RVGLAARHHALHVGARVDDPLGEQKTDREILVVARRAHRDRHVFFRAAAVRPRVAEANAERLLGRDDVGRLGRAVARAADAADLDAPDGVSARIFAAAAHRAPPTRLTTLKSMSCKLATPSSAMSRAISVFKIFKAFVAPASPPAPRP